MCLLQRETHSPDCILCINILLLSSDINCAPVLRVEEAKEQDSDKAKEQSAEAVKTALSKLDVKKVRKIMYIL